MKDSNRTTKIVKEGSWGAFHFLAFIGAVVYFVSQSGGGFWEVILALLKAIIWPVFAIYHVLFLLGA